ncbi:MAG: MFS transporter [Gammaproteobacteria bacterium RIFCSPHIGHO2_12_FULL_63_22]|nr:MAG: MFS transporter [Gammaproteobacteria bacterium RIFCSPHIGHO2_12_FULL_63_22]
MTAPASAPKKSITLRQTILALKSPPVAMMLALGFGSGLPFLLTGATFGYWLRDEGTTLTAIGFLSWVGLAYTFKFIWAPIVDRLPAPFLKKRGRRRGWVVLSQLLVAAGLLGMALVGPHGAGGLAAIGALALVVAFASATQDIAVDAWRIEAAADPDELGLFTSSFTLGYRIALLVTDALILIFAQNLGWPISYGMMAAAMGIGIFAAFRMPEPARLETAIEERARAASLLSVRGATDAVIGPLIEFFRHHGAWALLMLTMISVYRLPEFVIGPVAGPFYHDLGLEKDVVGGIRASVGLIASILGIAAGGVCAVRLGYIRTLILGAVLQGFGVAAYAVVATFGAEDLRLFGAAMATDNFCYAFAGVALVTYMSSLTSIGYTATQYALLSSIYTLFGKFLKGFSGAVVDALDQGRTLMQAYAIFYIGAGLIALPALILCVILTRQRAEARSGSSL